MFVLDAAFSRSTRTALLKASSAAFASTSPVAGTMVVALPEAALIFGAAHSKISVGLSQTRISLPFARRLSASSVPEWNSAAMPRIPPVSAAAARTTFPADSFTTAPA